MTTRLLVALLAFTLAACSSNKSARIAYIGDSITYGAPNLDSVRQKSPPPALLQEQLDRQFTVRNFGIPGATILPNRFSGYRKNEPHQAAKQYDPGLVVVALGTNDVFMWSFSMYPFSEEKLKKSYLEIVDDFPGAKVVLVTPPPLTWCPFKPLNGESIETLQRITAVIQDVGKERGYPVVNLTKVFNEHGGKNLFNPDGAHPNETGANVIAEAVAEAVKPLLAGK